MQEDVQARLDQLEEKVDQLTRMLDPVQGDAPDDGDTRPPVPNFDDLVEGVPRPLHSSLTKARSALDELEKMQSDVRMPESQSKEPLKRQKQLVSDLEAEVQAWNDSRAEDPGITWQKFSAKRYEETAAPMPSFASRDVPAGTGRRDDYPNVSPSNEVPDSFPAQDIQLETTYKVDTDVTNDDVENSIAKSVDLLEVLARAAVLTQRRLRQIETYLERNLEV